MNFPYICKAKLFHKLQIQPYCTGQIKNNNIFLKNLVVLFIKNIFKENFEFDETDFSHKKWRSSDEKIIADLNHSLENSRAVSLLEHPVYCVIPQIYQKFFNALYSVSQKLH